MDEQEKRERASARTRNASHAARATSGRHAGSTYTRRYATTSRAKSTGSRSTRAYTGNRAGKNEDREKYSAASGRYKTTKKGRKWPIVLAVVLAALIGVGIFAGLQAKSFIDDARSVKAQANSIMSDANKMKSQILKGKGTEAHENAVKIAEKATELRAHVNTDGWNNAKVIPTYGSDVEIVQELASILDDLSHNVLVPMTSDLEGFSVAKLVTSDGRIDIDSIQKLLTAINTYSSDIKNANERLGSVGTAHLEQINAPLEKAREMLGEVSGYLDYTGSIAPLISQVLGGNGEPRTYMLVAMSPSEARSVGGFVGSFGSLYIEDGEIDIDDFSKVTNLYDYNDEDHAPLTDEELAIFGTHVSVTPGNVSYMPQFSRVAEVLAYYWDRDDMGQLDGVIGVDPFFLQHVLELTDSVDVGWGITLDGDNAASVFLHDMYFLPSSYQDSFYEEAASLVFESVMENFSEIDPVDLFKSLKSDVEDHHLMIWMANPEEQQLMELLNCDNGIPDTIDKPEVGIYHNDDSWSKMFYYMTRDVTIGEPRAGDAGELIYPVEVHYHNALDEINWWSEKYAIYLYNGNDLKRSGADMVTQLYLVAPMGGSIENIECDGYVTPGWLLGLDVDEDVNGGFIEMPYRGTEIFFAHVQMLPGESFEMSFDVRVPLGATEPLVALLSPTCEEASGL